MLVIKYSAETFMSLGKMTTVNDVEFASTLFTTN